MSQGSKHFLRNEWARLLLLIITVLAACMETDMYLPAFHDMMVYFQKSEEAIQSTLTWNFLGLCISGPFYGPISDAFGRKKPLLISLGIFFIGSLFTVFGENFEVLLGGRFLQGLGSGGCFTLRTAIVFDVFNKKQALLATAKINIIVPSLMACAPLIGGFLTNTYGFRSNFITIALIVFFSFFAILIFFKESLPPSKRTPFSSKIIFEGFGRALTNNAFWHLTLIVSLLFSGYLLFLSNAAIFFVTRLGIPKPQFPFYQLLILGSYICGNLTAPSVSRRFSVDTLQTIGFWAIAIGGFGLVTITVLQSDNALLLTLPVAMYSFGAAWVQLPYLSSVMYILPDIKGIASSLLTSFRLLITAGLVGVVGSFYNDTIVPATVGVAFATIVPLLLGWHYRTRICSKKNTPPRKHLKISSKG